MSLAIQHTLNTGRGRRTGSLSKRLSKLLSKCFFDIFWQRFDRAVKSCQKLSKPIKTALWQVLTALSKRCQKLSNRFWQPCQKAVKPGFDSFWQCCQKLSKLVKDCQKLSKPVLTEEVLTGGRARNPSSAHCQKAVKKFDKGLTGLWQSFDRGIQACVFVYIHTPDMDGCGR